MYQLTVQFSDGPSGLLSVITGKHVLGRMLVSGEKFNPNFTPEGSNMLFSAVT